MQLNNKYEGNEISPMKLELALTWLQHVLCEGRVNGARAESKGMSEHNSAEEWIIS